MELEHAFGFNGGSKSPIHLVSNAGSTFAYSSGGSVVLADLQDMHKQEFLQGGHDDLITCLSVSRTGRLAASGQQGDNADVVIWNVAERSPVYRLQEHDHGVALTGISEDERFVFTIGVALDAKMVVWDLQTGCIVATVQNMKATDCACWGGRKKDIKKRDTACLQLATGGEGHLKIWTLDPAAGALTGEECQTTVKRNYTACAFSNDRDYLYAGSSSGDFTAFNVREKVMHSVIQACSNAVGALLPLPYRDAIGDEYVERLLVGGGDGTVSLFEGNCRDYRSRASVKLLGTATSLQLVREACDAPPLLLVGTDKGCIFEVCLAANPCDCMTRLVQESHCGAVCSVSFAPDDSQAFATAGHDGTVRLWNGDDYRVSAKAECQVSMTGQPSAVCFTGEVLFTGWKDGKIRAHDAEDGKLLWTKDDVHQEGVTSLVVSHNRKFLVSGGFQGEVRVWEIRTRQMIRHLKQHTMAVTSLQIMDDDGEAMSVSQDRSILFWDLVQGVRTSALTQKMGGINSVALHPNGQEFVTVGQEKRISFWRRDDSNPTAILSAGGSEQQCVTISADGQLFATGGADRKVRLFRFEDKELVAEGGGHSGVVRSVAFSPDGKQLVSVGDDGNVLLWNIFV